MWPTGASFGAGWLPSALPPLCFAGSVLGFGVTVLPDPPWRRLVELMKLAEQNGFDYGWTYDSHVLRQEPYPLLTLAARDTERITLGLSVTNPGTREPTVSASAFATLQDVSGGRMVMGIGRGDSARRDIGQKPVNIAAFEAACRMMPDLMNASGLPPALTDSVSQMASGGYYSEHSRAGASHGEQITDEACERFCILGPPETHLEKLRRLEAAGASGTSA